ncbi:MAG: hypothetical protein IJD07_02275 [Clostridia bacterium]|nr:hypothetical protein [Clostridia bacterium]
MFFSEIKKIVGLGNDNGAVKYNIVDFGGKILYVDGIKRVLHIGSDRVVMEFVDAVVTLEGDFAVQLLESDSLVIKGRVCSQSKEFKSRLGGEKRK